MKRCLLITGGLSSNKGDAAILEAGLHLFADELPDWKVRAESPFGSPLKTLAGIWRALTWDCVYMNVGHPIQDTTSLAYIPAVFLKSAVAALLGKETGMLAGGVSELRSKALRRLVLALLRRFWLVSVRDQDSARLLRAWGFRGEAVVGADPALLLRPRRTRWAGLLMAPLIAGVLLHGRLWPRWDQLGGKVDNRPLGRVQSPNDRWASGWGFDAPAGSAGHASPAHRQWLKTKLVIQIPRLNEEETLPVTLAQIPRALSGFDQCRDHSHSRR